MTPRGVTKELDTTGGLKRNKYTDNPGLLIELQFHRLNRKDTKP